MTYYTTLDAALDGIHKQDRDTLWCKPGADVGAMTHGHVCANLTVYGNGAYISGGERDFELDTYDSPGTKGSHLEGDVTLTVYSLNGAAAWGERRSEHALNITMVDCENMDRVYISGATGTNNITLTNCSFDATKTTAYEKANICSVYSNAPGSIQVENCSFTGIVCAVNLNNKGSADQSIEIKNCTFTDCSTEDICTGGSDLYSAPIRILSSAGADSAATVDSCTFTYTGSNTPVNGDILLGEGRTGEVSYPVTVNIVNTAANVEIHNPGDRADASTHNGEKIGVAASAEPAGVSNLVAKIGDQGYASLQSAVDAAKTTPNAVITVVKDVELTGSLNLSETVNLTLRGADKDITISASGIDGQKVISGVPSGSLTLRDLTFEDAIVTINGASGAVTVDGCTFQNTATTQTDKSGVLNIFNSQEDAYLTVVDSVFRGLTITNNCCEEFVGIYAAGPLQSITVEDSVFEPARHRYYNRYWKHF